MVFFGIEDGLEPAGVMAFSMCFSALMRGLLRAARGVVFGDALGVPLLLGFVPSVGVTGRLVDMDVCQRVRYEQPQTLESQVHNLRKATFHLKNQNGAYEMARLHRKALSRHMDRHHKATQTYSINPSTTHLAPLAGHPPAFA